MLDPRGARVTVDGVPVKLTSHEFRVLSYLMHHRGRIVSQSELTEHIYSQGFDRDSNTVEVFIARLRRKLGGTFIETVRGMGYRIEAEPTGRCRAERPGPRGNREAVLSLRAQSSSARFSGASALFLFSGLVLTHYMLYVPEAPGIFHGLFVHYMIAIALATVASMWIGLRQVRRGLGSFNELRTNLVGVREGRDTPAGRRVPVRGAAARQRVECALERSRTARDARADQGRRSRARIEDAADAPEPAGGAREGRGTDRAGSAIMQQVERMRRQVDYHLAHARASASGGNPTARCHVLTSADALARTMMTIHADRHLAIDVHVSHEHLRQEPA